MPSAFQRRGAWTLELRSFEEETPDFTHLTMTLRLRSLRAYEHWNGNTDLILKDIIYRLAEQGAFNPPA